MAPSPGREPKTISDYRDFFRAYGGMKRLRYRAKDLAVWALSVTRSIPAEKNWIRFVYYHHVFDDERRGFHQHLKFFRKQGEFIGMDDAVSRLESGAPLPGRYFCLTFDDGYKNCLTNATPILVEHKATALFYLPTGYIGVEQPRYQIIASGALRPRPMRIEFLTWDDCRRMVGAGMGIGSHTVGHVSPARLTPGEVEVELRESKQAIEKMLGIQCRHFSCPAGKPGIDFLPERDPRIAAQVGYSSFATTCRGSWRHRANPMLLEREHAIAAQGIYYLEYFLSR